MWLSVGMCRQRNMPNPENCALAELETAAKASSVQRSYVRLMAIKALIMGLPHKQVAALFGVNEDSVSRWVRRFNQRGIDGLTEGPRSGRPPKISGEQAYEYSKLVLHPELVNETPTGPDVSFTDISPGIARWRQATAHLCGGFTMRIFG